MTLDNFREIVKQTKMDPRTAGQILLQQRVSQQTRTIFLLVAEKNDIAVPRDFFATDDDVRPAGAE